MTASKFTLMLRLRARYLLYSIISLFTYSFLGSQFLPGASGGYTPGLGFTDHSDGQIWGFLIGVGIGIYLMTQAVSQAMNFYSHNQIGRGRVARAFFRHRDVVQFDTSIKSHWQSTKRYSFYLHVIPANLYGGAVLLGLGTFLNRGMGILTLFVAGGLFLLGKLSESFATQHLCTDETNEMYERPQSYVDVVSQAKQEVRERKAQDRAQEMLERERQRNSPPLPNPKQNRKPRKPY